MNTDIYKEKSRQPGLGGTQGIASNTNNSNILASSDYSNSNKQMNSTKQTQILRGVLNQ